MKTCHAVLGQRAEGGGAKAEVGRWFRLLTGGCVLLLLCAFAPLPGRAGLTLKTLATFYGTNGAQPYAGLMLGTNGNFYGTTSSGGTNGGYGTVFSFNPTNQNIGLLHSFSGGADGAIPLSGLMQGLDGNLYGTASAGGSNNLGTVFAVDTLGQLVTLGSFDGTNGAGPQCVLVQNTNDGSLYGTTLSGGAFYGTTNSGGTNFGFGAVFSLMPQPPAGPGVAWPLRSGPGISLLASFDSTNTGAYPAAGLTLDNYGNLYGVTSAGGSVYGSGTFFQVLPGSGTPLLPLFSFSGTNGAFSQAPLLLSTNIATNGYYFIYGTTAEGGTNNIDEGGDGTIFGITAYGATTNLLSLSFAKTNGASPAAGLIEGADGNFYGTTVGGGAHNSGAIFSFNPSNSTPIKLLYSFSGGPNGKSPYGGLVQGTDGNFYGTTLAGGKGNKGTIFQLSGFSPYIITQPTNQTVQTSNTVTIAVVAGGSAPLIYEWRFNSNTLSNVRNYSGATSSVLTLTNAVPANSGSYSVIIKNAAGSITSTNAALLVVNPPGRPSLRITDPAQNTYLKTTAVTVTGDTSGTVTVAHVFFRLNGGSWHPATEVNGWSRWSAGVTLSPGTNHFEAYAASFSGTSSPTNSAYFVPSPFAQVAGSYNGLFYDPANVTPANAGFFTLQTTYLGKFSGALQMAGTHYSFGDQFDANGVGQATIPMSKSAPLTVWLQLDMTRGTDHLTGSVSNQTWAAALAGDLDVFNGSTSIAPQQGNYTLVIPGAGAAPRPAGDSWGTVKLDAAGNVHLSGSLADGTSIAQTVPVSRGGAWPLYASLYSGQGLLLGWLALSSDSNQALAGNVLWLKSASSTAKYYANGLTLRTNIQGSPYTAPGGGTNLFNATNLVVVLSGGGLAQSITNHITLDANNKVVNLGSNKLSLSFSSSAGSFKGSVAGPAPASKSISFNGVVLENQGAASGLGFFLGSGQSGQVSIAPEAAP
jgi:uncharacterized repeat protein (TIGR03803 family)